jgi:hypothetical protein
MKFETNLAFIFIMVHQTTDLRAEAFPKKNLV